MKWFRQITQWLRALWVQYFRRRAADVHAARAKAFFEASRSITQEKMAAKKGQATESQVQTARYLRWLRRPPSIEAMRESEERRYLRR